MPIIINTSKLLETAPLGATQPWSCCGGETGPANSDIQNAFFLRDTVTLSSLRTLVRAGMYLRDTFLVQEAEIFARRSPCLAVKGGWGRMLVGKVILPNYSSIKPPWLNGL